MVFFANSNVLYNNNSNIRRNTQGSAYIFYNGIIDWKVIRQKTVITNTIKIKLLEISAVAKNIL